MLTASLCDWRYSHADLLFIEVLLDLKSLCDKCIKVLNQESSMQNALLIVQPYCAKHVDSKLV